MLLCLCEVGDDKRVRSNFQQWDTSRLHQKLKTNKETI